MCCCLSEVCVPRFCVSCLKESVSIRLSRCGPCLPFYSFQGEGSGYICGKKVKQGKDEREKQKYGLRCGYLPPYPVLAVSPIA
jgi:hypothetical protein